MPVATETSLTACSCFTMLDSAASAASCPAPASAAGGSAALGAASCSASCTRERWTTGERAWPQGSTHMRHAVRARQLPYVQRVARSTLHRSILSQPTLASSWVQRCRSCWLLL